MATSPPARMIRAARSIESGEILAISGVCGDEPWLWSSGTAEIGTSLFPWERCGYNISATKDAAISSWGGSMTYRAPVSDIFFALYHVAGFSRFLEDGTFGD